MGLRTSAVHDGLTLGYQYDTFGRINSQTHQNGLAVSYTYDVANNLVELTYPDASQVAYGYDALNRVVCAEEGAANLNDPCASAGRRLASIAYDAQSRRQSVSYADDSITADAIRAVQKAPERIPLTAFSLAIHLGGREGAPHL